MSRRPRVCGEPAVPSEPGRRSMAIRDLRPFSIAPALHVRVRDAYVSGRGSGQVAFLSAFTVVSQEGGIEMNSGLLHRDLAEAVWYPTALIPNDSLRWTPVDERTADAVVGPSQDIGVHHA